MKPFAEQAPHLTTVDVIDSINNLDIDYEHPAIMVAGMKGSETKQFAPASEGLQCGPRDGQCSRWRRESTEYSRQLQGTFAEGWRNYFIASGISTRLNPNNAKNCKKNAIARF